MEKKEENLGIKAALNYAKKQRKRFQRELFDWLRIPSVSADSAYRQDVLASANFVAGQLSAIGMDKVKIRVPSKAAGRNKIAYPVVTAEKVSSSQLPTVLIYGHYDVQPPDPIDLWESPPFEPTVRKGRVYARGANDNKGQVFSHIKSLESCLKNGELPVNVKFLIEGEEEISSANLPGFVEKNRNELKADYVLISDTEMLSPNIPAITYGLRGLCFLEIMVVGPRRDIHSGIWGGGVPNPANVLTKMLADLTDKDYRIKEPSFYLGMKGLTEKEKKNFAKLPWSRKETLQKLGMDNILTSEKIDFFKRTSALPTFDINGMVSGYTGEGEKTIIPSWAKAKLSFRLIPGQDYRQVIKVMAAALKKLLPPKQGLTLKFLSSSGGEGFVTDLDSPGIRAAQRALKKTFGHEGYCVRFGGSIPIVGTLRDQLKADVVMMGFGLAEDGIHSPNESYSLRNFHCGIEASIRFLHEISDY